MAPNPNSNPNPNPGAIFLGVICPDICIKHWKIYISLVKLVCVFKKYGKPYFYTINQF